MYKSSDYYGDKLAEIWYPMSKAWKGKKDASECLECFIDSIDNPEKYEEDYASTKGVFNKTIKRWYEDKPELLKRLKEFEEEFSKETLMYCSPDTNQLWKAQIEQVFFLC